jgi:hypothetical protein
MLPSQGVNFRIESSVEKSGNTIDDASDFDEQPQNPTISVQSAVYPGRTIGIDLFSVRFSTCQSARMRMIKRRLRPSRILSQESLAILKLLPF